MGFFPRPDPERDELGYRRRDAPDDDEPGRPGRRQRTALERFWRDAISLVGFLVACALMLLAGDPRFAGLAILVALGVIAWRID